LTKLLAQVRSGLALAQFLTPSLDSTSLGSSNPSACLVCKHWIWIKQDDRYIWQN
jgi:hypothetical protein